ncbi:MAG: zinc ribbon domain-containing protein [Deltaproteobacteria bacterium]|nr:zinc ribbon domain-containing protein [Deltaproteobacteria bacterium]
MPLYEYFCGDCLKSFEALVPLSASRQSTHTCPGCGALSQRILSAVNFAPERRTPSMLPDRIRDDKPDITSLRLPPAARLCWMDDRSAARLAAYQAGRGAEYDDTVAARKEVALRRGDNESSEPAQLAHSHSPLSDPVTFANRRKAAQKEKVAESATIRKNVDAKEE